MSRPMKIMARSLKDGKETIYESLTECAMALGLGQSRMSKVLKYQYVNFRGYRLTVLYRHDCRVVVTAPDGTKEIYDSVWDAADAIDRSDHTIRRMIRTGKKNRDGYTARYAEAEEEENT